ncbi:MAG: hypothetical protein JJ896_15480 [Rhodothermales bacterium]|nr:hypothetical protein [Rhodothermales bacterium]MBO6781056.1 hypothetical protein [Rhodothermales bacterium]
MAKYRTIKDPAARGTLSRERVLAAIDALRSERQKAKRQFEKARKEAEREVELTSAR